MKQLSGWMACTIILVACSRAPGPAQAAAPVAAAPSRVIEVPRAPVPPKTGPELLDGHEWGVSYHGDAFVDASGHQQPHAHLQFMADDAKLYVGYYAADQDLRTRPRPDDPRGAVGDRATLKIGPLVLTLDPKGGVVPAGVELQTVVDGTVDNSSDDDEEWVAQLTIPWALLGPHAREEGVLVRALRTDAPKGQPERALAWPARGYARLQFSQLRGAAARSN